MRTDRARLLLAGVIALLLAGAACAAEEPAAGEKAAEEGKEKAGVGWQHWQPNTSVTDLASVQRGARNFVSYCLGCHSLKYERWSRLGSDLEIPPDLLQKDLIPPGDKATQ